ncbi:MAG: phosphotransferase [Alphaproteobacteria bacterium]
MSAPAAVDGVQITEVRAAHRIDEKALASYLAERIPGFKGPLVVRQFEGGQSNPTYLLSDGAREWVMRKKPPGKLLPSAHAVDREYRVMKALADTAVPVPKMELLCEDDGVIGTAFFVMEKVEGRVLADVQMPSLTPPERRAIYNDFIDKLAALHSVDYQAVGLEGFGRPGSYYARQIGRWSKQYEGSKTDQIDAMDRLMEWLPANIPDDDETSIVHGDYRPGNCIIHPSEPRIVAVLDWELSTLGQALGDVAYCCMGYHGNLGTAGNLAAIDHAAMDIPTEQEFLARYCEKTGRPGIENWPFYLVFALFRIAAIGQGVYKRGLDGIASSDRATQFADVCRIRAEIAWNMVTDAKLD